MTYFRTGNPYYHRRAAVSRSCSRWEGVVPAGCGRQALISNQKSEVRRQISQAALALPVLVSCVGLPSRKVR